MSTVQTLRHHPIFALITYWAFINFMAATLATAQQGKPRPQIGFADPQVRQATRSVDVTAAVAALVRGNELEVLASRALAGRDPAPQTLKKLLVSYAIGTQQLAAAVMEGQTLIIASPVGAKLSIQKALYGDMNFPVIDVTGRVRSALQGDKISLPVNNQNLTAGSDPAHLKAKKLRVKYRVGATAHTVIVAENQILDLPALGDGVGTLSIESASYGDLDADPNASFMAIVVAMPPVKPRLALPALLISPIRPLTFQKRGETYFADFGKDAFGNLRISFPGAVPVATLVVRLGEKLGADGTIDRNPPGSVNFREIPLVTRPDQRVYQLQIPSKPRHADQAAVHTPAEIGEITPFRYAEIENSPLVLDAGAVGQLAVHTAFDEGASSFRSSDETLNAVWDLCKHTVKATTAFGVYIDGERERIPYEGDAYINQLSHLAVDANPEVARYTVEHLLEHPTWPTEWSLHMPMMAAADYQATGDISLSARNYQALKAKLGLEKAREDGLLRASAIVDWPQSERDGYNDGVADPNQKQQVGPLINTVANAFYFHALQKMALLARALKNDADAQLFERKAAQVYAAFNLQFFDPARGVYLDGEGSTHASLHANMFALTFDLVPAERQKRVADWVQSRGMACSVYGAQYLLEALYKAGKDDYALQLLTAKNERSWWHMIELGSTLTLEAWDAKFKGNLTWNHAWGAAPANIISRFVLGVRPLEPGYKRILIAPRPGGLQWAQGKVPTARGPVLVNFQNQTDFRLEIEVPPGTLAQVALPITTGLADLPPQVLLDGKPVVARLENTALVIDNVGSGRYVFQVK